MYVVGDQEFPDVMVLLDKIYTSNSVTQVIWDTCQEKVKKKYLSTLILVTEIPDKNKSIPVRRFVIRQTEKVRPADIYKRSGINDATASYSKLQLPSLVYFVETDRRMQQKTEEALANVKLDHENTYKQLPVIQEHIMLSIIVARSPEVGIIHKAFLNQWVFGSACVVQRIMQLVE